MNIDLLWARYREEERGARDELILHYHPLVERVAGGMNTGLPASVDRADLVSDGLFGLIEAIETYDPSRGVTFEAFARQRIRYAVLNGLRGLDWAPRGVREPARQLQRAKARLVSTLRREPTDTELAAEMGMTPEAVSRLMSDIAVASVGSFRPELEEWYGSTFEKESPDTARPSVFDPEELADNLADAIVALPERERVVFTLYYVEEVTFLEIGELLDISKVRVNQIRDDAMDKIREALAGR